MENYSTSLHLTYKALAKMLFVFDIRFEEFHKSLRAYYVRAVYQDRKNIVRTSLKTGLDRRMVSAIIKDDEAAYRTSIFDKILAKVLKLAKSQAQINKYGKKSINEIMQKTALGSTTVNTIVTELVALGWVKDLGDSVLFSKAPTEENYNEILEEVSAHINLYITTIIQRELRNKNLKLDIQSV